MDTDKFIIEQWIDAHKPELVDLLTRMIAARTENPPGNESAAAAELDAYFKRYSIPSESFAEKPGRVNLIGRIGSGGKNAAAARTSRHGPGRRRLDGPALCRHDPRRPNLRPRRVGR